MCTMINIVVIAMPNIYQQHSRNFLSVPADHPVALATRHLFSQSLSLTQYQYVVPYVCLFQPKLSDWLKGEYSCGLTYFANVPPLSPSGLVGIHDIVARQCSDYCPVGSFLEVQPPYT